ncbi:NAD(+) diphosphatase [Aureimonas endophytica]|uniref:NAD(+) diphosphatase n=1 Tax=Aureimonas endophytica TaxID=2027858 RepID=UPI001FCEE9B4|nr:NAD(+) diphosphatase [Aureimonas endophytica]
MPLHLGFAVNTLWRDGELRTESTLAEALAHPAARFHLLAPEGWLAAGGDLVFDRAAAERLGGEDATLLGIDANSAPTIVMRVSASPDGLEARPLRALASGDLVEPELEGRLGQGEHLLNWHRRTRFCGLCGGPTVAEAAGYRRRCTSCNEAHFPRTDPVSIMLVHDRDGRCLLGRGPHFPSGMWSCLAGFVEPGETLEAAVRRETKEEAGIEVGRVRYLASQPWPFPGSLMIGCLAEALSAEIVFDGVELEGCRWFERAEVLAMLEERHPEGISLPKPFAIAHHLIRAFAEGGETA